MCVYSLDKSKKRHLPASLHDKLDFRSENNPPAAADLRWKRKKLEREKKGGLNTNNRQCWAICCAVEIIEPAHIHIHTQSALINLASSSARAYADFDVDVDGLWSSLGCVECDWLTTSKLKWAHYQAQQICRRRRRTQVTLAGKSQRAAARAQKKSKIQLLPSFFFLSNLRSRWCSLTSPVCEI